MFPSTRGSHTHPPPPTPELTCPAHAVAHACAKLDAERSGGAVCPPCVVPGVVPGACWGLSRQNRPCGWRRRRRRRARGWRCGLQRVVRQRRGHALYRVGHRAGWRRKPGRWWWWRRRDGHLPGLDAPRGRCRRRRWGCRRCWRQLRRRGWHSGRSRGIRASWPGWGLLWWGWRHSNSGRRAWRCRFGLCCNCDGRRRVHLCRRRRQRRQRRRVVLECQRAWRRGVGRGRHWRRQRWYRRRRRRRWVLRRRRRVVRSRVALRQRRRRRVELRQHRLPRGACQRR